MVSSICAVPVFCSASVIGLFLLLSGFAARERGGEARKGPAPGELRSSPFMAIRSVLVDGHHRRDGELRVGKRLADSSRQDRVGPDRTARALQGLRADAGEIGVHPLA